jgi:2-dehydro-3-deoxyphosphooctonate aldolase (KDO 8-P synthase)
LKLCSFDVGLERPLFLIAGPCVVESEQLQIDVAGQLKEITGALGVPFIFKSSYDKANRSSGTSFRGPGMEKGLEILAKVRRELAVPVLTDVHREEEIAAAAEVVDVLQTPAFLCRQTDFIRAVAQSGKPVNIKKGQFLAPHDMTNVLDKARAGARDAGLSEDRFMACERGASFGYNNLVSDMRSLAIMRETKAPVVFDATHSVQLPGGQGTSSGGQREFVPVLARAAVAVGIAGIFMETHPRPAEALSDGPNACRCSTCARFSSSSSSSTAPSSRGRSSSARSTPDLECTSPSQQDKNDERHRRHRRPRDPRQPRQSDRRMRRAPRIGNDGPRRGAVGRVDRLARGDRAARRRPGALRRQGRAARDRAHQHRDQRGRARPRLERAGVSSTAR